ncbi:MAG: sulfatase-like hydrolase/transferase [Planctomycetes bacterium]|nr:sulfatase-like hydrolase/transferase [Planctomycetota bacterium]
MWNRNRLHLCRLFTVVGVLVGLFPVRAPAVEKPNIVIVFTDDQGYGDLQCFGSETIRTPRIDQLAREGTRFTSFYAQVVCGPSRSALLTGRYPVRSGGWSMPAGEITIGELLQKAGYTTGCFGKWDVSNRAAIPERMPNAKGFDYYWGTLGANDSARVIFHENNKEVGRSGDMASLTRIYTDKSIEFLEANRDRPFFLYLAHTMVHSVIDASPKFKGKSQGGLYGDTVEELDYHTGRLLDALDRLKLRDNTIVIFTSDNGGLIPKTNNAPLRSGKGFPYEGGIREPVIVRWPGVVEPGSVNHTPVTSVDYFPTICEIVGVDLPEGITIDGESLTPLLKQTGTLEREDIFWHFPHYRGKVIPYSIIRSGDWKLLKRYDGTQFELYNLKDDLSEENDLAESMPEKVKELDKKLRAYLKESGAHLPKINPDYEPAASSI